MLVQVARQVYAAALQYPILQTPRITVDIGAEQYLHGRSPKGLQTTVTPSEDIFTMVHHFTSQHWVGATCWDNSVEG